MKVFVESGAEYPDLSANESFEIVDAAIAEMEAVAKAGGNFILEQDVTLFRPLVVEGALTLDLNDKETDIYILYWIKYHR